MPKKCRVFDDFGVRKEKKKAKKDFVFLSIVVRVKKKKKGRKSDDTGLRSPHVSRKNLPKNTIYMT